MEKDKVTIFELKNKALHSENGESFRILVASHACYMIYGILKPKEKGRLVNPGVGHEEIVLVVTGNLKVTGYYSGSVEEGSAFHIKDEQKCFLENLGEIEAVYIIAGGHSEGGHH